MPAGTKRPKFQEELFDLKGYSLEGFPQQKMRDEQITIKKEEDHFTWAPGDSVKRDDLGVASERAEPANASAWPQIKEEPEFPQQQHKRKEQSPIKKEEQNVTGSTGEPFRREDNLGRANRAAQTVNCSSAEGMQAYNVIAPPPDGDNVLHDNEGFRENLSPDGQEFNGLKIKEEETEFPQQQIKEESPWPQIKEEEPEFSQQTMIDEQLPIKNEEDYVTWSPSESVKWDDLGVASVGMEPENAQTWLQIIEEEEPQFPQQCKREEHPPFKNEECVKWSTVEPFKSEDDLGVAKRGTELLSGISTEGWRSENLIAPLSDDNDLLFDDDDVEDVKKNPSGDKLCKCFQCGKTFGKKSNLKRHMRSHTGEKFLSCTVCGETFTHKGKFKMHTITHTGKKPFCCSVCGQRFTHKESLGTHTGKKPFSCSVCGKAFSQKQDLQIHRRKQPGEKPFSCSVCGKTFTEKGNLKRHSRTHTGEKPFSCSICGKAFSQKQDLQIHTRTHTGEKPFSCSVCSQAFTHKKSLKSHARTHTGEKPFSCSVCGRRFTHKKSLKPHIRTHTGEKPFSCSICGHAFSQQQPLIRHTRTHTGEKPFSCSVCNQRFTRKGSLISHARTHTGEKTLS
ncbi:uncharacterized protein LOC144064152 isoform X1 [Stigmatopora argus]